MVRAMSTFAAARRAHRSRDRWQWARLRELSVADLYAVMVARQDVFAVEQGCAFLDADGLDAYAWHLLGWVRAAPSRFSRATCGSSTRDRSSPNPRSGGC